MEVNCGKAPTQPTVCFITELEEVILKPAESLSEHCFDFISVLIPTLKS